MFNLKTKRRFTPSRFAEWDADKRPVILMREATLEEWMAWRQVQLEIEQKAQQRYEHRLIECGLTAEEYDEAVQYQLNHLKARTAKALEAQEAAKLKAQEAKMLEDQEPQEETPPSPEHAEAGQEAQEAQEALVQEDAELKVTRVKLEAFSATFDPAVDVERMLDLDHTITLLNSVIVGFERVCIEEDELMTWDVTELKAMGLTRRQILMALAGPGREGLTVLVEMGNFAVQGLSPDQKKASTAT